MKPLSEILKSKKNGLYYGNRVILPFVVDILKAVIENDIITDFSQSGKGAHYFKSKLFTEIYFYDFKQLSEVISEYETIKLVVVEEGMMV